MSRRSVTVLVSLLLALVAVTPGGPAVAAEQDQPDPGRAGPATAGVVRGGDVFRSPLGGTCLVSFTVRAADYDGFVTAGRCGQVGAPAYTVDGVLLGTFHRVTFPNSDYAVVRLAPGWVPVGEVRTSPNATMAVKGSTEVPLGGSVCKYGPQTYLRCGVAQAKQQTLYFGTYVLYGLTRTNICPGYNEVGAPIMAGDQAQGITIIGSGDCTYGGTTYFQPVNKVLTAYGLTLITS
ncbi:hypothetical protein GCM10027290_50760 [Micromonospora sonneratiae]|uniref:S1 family peptidase n=1 Tax=Micromonospora sonneratiae TaxID=1184706 RepID=A0ABW3Y671_9ACTN